MGLKGKPIFEKTIESLADGETGYTLPWALAFDEKGIAYLNIGMTVKKLRMVLLVCL
jgi:hypothetical protein